MTDIKKRGVSNVISQLWKHLLIISSISIRLNVQPSISHLTKSR